MLQSGFRCQVVKSYRVDVCVVLDISASHCTAASIALSRCDNQMYVATLRQWPRHALTQPCMAERINGIIIDTGIRCSTTTENCACTTHHQYDRSCRLELCSRSCLGCHGITLWHRRLPVRNKFLHAASDMHISRFGSARFMCLSRIPQRTWQISAPISHAAAVSAASFTTCVLQSSPEASRPFPLPCA